MNQMTPIIMIVASVTLYNICQKSTPAIANPYISLIVAYGISLIVTLTLFIVQGTERGIWQELKLLNWTSLALGVTIVGIELGYLFLYRVGWNLAIGSLLVNIIAAIILIFVGVLLYKERLELIQIAGIGLCVGGLILINWKSLSS